MLTRAVGVVGEARQIRPHIPTPEGGERIFPVERVPRTFEWGSDEALSRRHIANDYNWLRYTARLTRQRNKRGHAVAGGSLAQRAARTQEQCNQERLVRKE